MPRSSWEILATEWTRYSASLPKGQRISKSRFSLQIGFSSKIVRNWMLAPSVGKNSIPIRHIPEVCSALGMQQDKIDLLIAARIRERKLNDRDPEYEVLGSFVARMCKRAAMKAVKSDDGKYIVDLFHSEAALHPYGHLGRDILEMEFLQDVFRSALDNALNDHVEQVGVDSNGDHGNPEELEAKKQAVLAMLQEQAEVKKKKMAEARRAEGGRSDAGRAREAARGKILDRKHSSKKQPSRREKGE